jgi:hypothetical protein
MEWFRTQGCVPPVAGVLTALTLVVPASAQAQNATLGQVLLFHQPGLEQGARRPKAPVVPGVKTHLFRADRGNRKGQSIVVWTIDTLQRRRDLPSPVKPGAPYSEYHLLSPETVGPLPSVDVLGIHYIKVLPDRRDAFERFVKEKLHPAVANLRPDLRVLYYKSVLGPDAGNYIAVFALTRRSRDKYWPGGADSNDLRLAFRPVQPLTKELRTYLVEGSYLADDKYAAAVYESRDWVDFVRIAAASR